MIACPSSGTMHRVPRSAACRTARARAADLASGAVAYVASGRAAGDGQRNPVGRRQGEPVARTWLGDEELLTAGGFELRAKPGHIDPGVLGLRLIPRAPDPPPQRRMCKQHPGTDR